ncbi:hypothetical protein [Humisphaera borealis]|uniref:Uncharacterized protein n=1 Tax=Humisphaera borealis TaxID=2807512 RepID=A0A7M2X370_9BACT|nr:hypothetical protein [Humisphaera borealis]QOV91210.1 hypothetical protein IPV69_07585 [Humisphaera borealis]
MPVRILLGFITILAVLSQPDLQAAATQPAVGQPQIVTVTLTDDGKTIPVAVGQEVRVVLKGDRKQTGWEVGQPHGTALTPVVIGGSYGQAAIPAVEFRADNKGVDDIGDYTFRYNTIAPGVSKLRFVYLYPGGSKPTARTATRLIREFSVIVEVGGKAATQPAPGVALAPKVANQPQMTVLRGTAIPQVDHNAVVDRTKYNMVVEVVGERDNLTRYAVCINPVSSAFIARDHGAKPVVVTGAVEREGDLHIIVPVEIERQHIPKEP